VEVDEGGNATMLTQRRRRNKLRCSRSMYGMRKGDERERVLKI